MYAAAYVWAKVLSHMEERLSPVTVSAWFDDAAFIGDSVTLKLRNYHMSTGALGNATFLCVGSYSVNNAVTGQLYLSYKGQDMSPENALAACGAKKVLSCLLVSRQWALWAASSRKV